MKEEFRFFGFPSVTAGASDLRHGRRIALLLRAWPFSVAPRPLGPTSRPRGYPKVLVLTSCRARGLWSPPRVPAPAKCSGVRQPPPGFRASRASMGSWGFAGRCPQWQTASSSGAAELEVDNGVWGEVRTISAVALVLLQF